MYYQFYAKHAEARLTKSVYGIKPSWLHQYTALARQKSTATRWCSGAMMVPPAGFEPATFTLKG